MSTIANTPLLKYADIIGTPFEVGGRSLRGLDCRGATLLVLHRMGIDVPEDALPERHRTAEEVAREIATMQGPMPWARFWDSVSPTALRLGDVAFYRGPESAHVAPIVACWPGRPVLALSCSPKRGARLVPVFRLGGLQGFYRLREVLR